MPLSPHLPFDPVETPLSFAARLAAFHIGNRVGPFLSDLGIDAVDLACGVEGAVRALCDHASVDPDLVFANAAISTGTANHRLRRHEISADVLANPRTVFCPACLLDDDRAGSEPALARRGRFVWSLDVVRTCPTHGIALAERARERWGDQLHELAVRVPERGEALRAMAEAATRREVSPMQDYVLSRLSGATGPQWLDSQSLEQAIRATEVLGAVVAFGPSRNVSGLTSDEWDQAGRVGYAFTSRGEAGIREALFHLQGEFRKDRQRPVHGNVFGRLYHWLASKSAKDPGDIRRIVREHIFDTIEMAPGTVLLGGKLPERRLHSVASLARETGLYTATLRRVLILRGLIPREGAHHVVDATVAREVAASVRELVHVNSLGKVLNCSRYQALGLVDEQILPPIAMGEAGAPGRTQKGVDARNIRAFLAALSASTRVVDVVPPGSVPIAKAAEKVKTSRVDIIHLVLGGYLSNVVRLSSMEGYAAIHVDPVEVRLMLNEHMIGVSVSVAAARLHLPIRTVWALLEDCKGGALLESMVVHAPNGRHSLRRILPETLERFQGSYATSGQLASSLLIRQDEVERELRSARLRPAITSAEVGVDFYRAAELPPRFSLQPTRLAP